MAMHRFDTVTPDRPGLKKSIQRIEALRKEGGIFVEAVRLTRSPIIVTDPNLPGNPIVFANGAFLAASGYEMNEVLGRGSHFMAGRETDEEALRRLDAALAGGRNETIEVVQYRREGEAFTAVIFACPV